MLYAQIYINKTLLRDDPQQYIPTPPGRLFSNNMKIYSLLCFFFLTFVALSHFEGGTWNIFLIKQWKAPHFCSQW